MSKYVQSKIEHMKRLGLIGAKSRGVGKNGGACPDWLKQQQDEE